MTSNIQHTIIIGGSSGIGLATARKLLGPGMKVTITGRNQDKLNSAWKGLGGAAGKAAFDASKPDEVRQFFGEVGPFDHLVLAASGGKGLARSQASTLPTSPVASTRKSGRSCLACRRLCRRSTNRDR